VSAVWVRRAALLAALLLPAGCAGGYGYGGGPGWDGDVGVGYYGGDYGGDWGYWGHGYDVGPGRFRGGGWHGGGPGGWHGGGHGGLPSLAAGAHGGGGFHGGGGGGAHGGGGGGHR
jgi:hypothetical protein